MKSKRIFLAAAVAAATAITAVAVAQSSDEAPESIPAVESAVVSDESAEIVETAESTPAENAGEPEAAEDAPESAPAHYEGTVEAVDPVDDRITYTFDAVAEGAAFTRHWSGEVEDRLEILNHTESNSASLEYLKEFFGTDSLPVDERFKGGIERVLSDGHFDCDAAEGAEAYSPVEGIVIAASPEPRYNGGLGAFVAVEFDNKIFIIAHLDELYVEVGDAVSAGQALGVCGHSGHVYVGDPPLMTLITMIVED